MHECDRRAGAAGRLTLPSGQALPITDWRFETIAAAGPRLAMRGRFRVAAAIPPALARGPLEVKLLVDEQPDAFWRGAVTLTDGALGPGEVRFQALHELRRVGPT